MPPLKEVHNIGVKRLGMGHDKIDFIASYEDHLTALKAVNKLNCTKGIKTGDLYVLETMTVPA